MLSFFRTNHLAISALLVFYAAVLHLPTLLSPEKVALPASAHAGIWGVWVYEQTGYQGLIPAILTIILLLVHAILINTMVSNNRLASVVSLFPGLFYILIASSLPDFLSFSPIHIANTFYILALWALMGTYKQPTCADRIFNIGMWLGIASLFYPLYLFFFLVAFIGLNILRAYKIREWLMVVSGIAVPYILVAVYCFWKDSLDVFIKLQFEEPFQLFNFANQSGWEHWVGLAFFAFLILIALGSFGLYNFKMQLQVQKKISVLYWALLISGLSVFIQKGAGTEHLLVAAVPLGIMLSFNFINMSARWAEMLHLVLLVLILCWQYKDYFIGI